MQLEITAVSSRDDFLDSLVAHSAKFNKDWLETCDRVYEAFKIDEAFGCHIAPHPKLVFAPDHLFGINLELAECMIKNDGAPNDRVLSDASLRVVRDDPNKGTWDVKFEEDVATFTITIEPEDGYGTAKMINERSLVYSAAALSCDGKRFSYFHYFDVSDLVSGLKKHYRSMVEDKLDETAFNETLKKISPEILNEEGWQVIIHHVTDWWMEDKCVCIEAGDGYLLDEFTEAFGETPTAELVLKCLMFTWLETRSDRVSFMYFEGNAGTDERDECQMWSAPFEAKQLVQYSISACEECSMLDLVCGEGNVRHELKVL